MNLSVRLVLTLNKYCYLFIHSFVHSFVRSFIRSFIIIDQMDKKNLTAMVLIDLSKTFDSISHDILLQKLTKFDISISAIKWFESYLEERFQSVRIENHLSEPELITHGVPQGSILGPLP